MKTLLGFCILLMLSISCDDTIDRVEYIDPFIGTDGPGHTYPGASLPFGMVQLSPDTRLSGWEGCSGYQYSDSLIYGFSHTHLSGTGASDYGDVLLMPTLGEVQINPGGQSDDLNGYSSFFKHSKEYAEAGYYSVFLEDHRILAELTASQRVGLHSYEFPKSNQANIILDLNHRDQVLNAFIHVINEYQVEGLRRSQNWAADQYVYFVMEFSKPFKDFCLYLNDNEERGNEVTGSNLKAHFTFSTKRKEKIKVKVGLSPVSVSGAWANMETEMPGWNFNKVRADARKAWREVVDKFQIEGGSEAERRNFYTAVYHQYLNPNIYMDVDSMYRGRDLLVHKAENFTNFTLFSLWDTFRATHPLFTITEPDLTTDFVKTFLTQFDQGGLLPVWELSANETGTMIGYHAVSVIADAMLKGINNYDTERAYEAMKTSAEQEHLGLKYYKELGYIPGSEEGESVSKTLEYAYDDWCIAKVAGVLNYDSEEEYYLNRSLNYRNLFDPEVDFFRAKLGPSWFSPFDPKEVNYNYTEANAWQYSFFVPHDIEGMKELYGGNQGFIEKLDQLFQESSETTGRVQADITGLIGQYAHGNEPSHHMAYLYNYAGQPWKTQNIVDKILRELYNDTPNGLCGNEDCGQMSAWYLFSAMGFYPVTPGSATYALGAPLFPSIQLILEKGSSFVILAPQRTPQNKYIQSVTLNGVKLERSYIEHDEIMRGGELVFNMGPEPNEKWASDPSNCPVTTIDRSSFIDAPFVKTGSRTFEESTQVELACLDTTVIIKYQVITQSSLGTSNFRTYNEPITLRNDRMIRFYGERDSLQTPVMEALFTKLSPNRRIELFSDYAPQYTAGGPAALIDKIRGARNFRTGAWQGYEGIDVIAEIDLGFNQTIHRLALSCFQNQDFWIFMPARVIYECSANGEDWEVLGSVENQIEEDLTGAFIQEFLIDVWKTARYIRVTAKSRGLCPVWHKGAGGKAWIFVDELLIE